MPRPGGKAREGRCGVPPELGEELAGEVGVNRRAHFVTGPELEPGLIWAVLLWGESCQDLFPFLPVEALK